MDDEPAAGHTRAGTDGWSCAYVGCVFLVVAGLLGLVVYRVSADLLCGQECEESRDADMTGVVALFYGGLAFIGTVLVGGLVLLLIKGSYGYGRRRR